jgi:hypothetical protein
MLLSDVALTSMFSCQDVEGSAKQAPARNEELKAGGEGVEPEAKVEEAKTPQAHELVSAVDHTKQQLDPAKQQLEQGNEELDLNVAVLSLDGSPGKVNVVHEEKTEPSSTLPSS